MTNPNINGRGDYTQPYDPRRPQVCLDETSVQLVGEKRTPLPMAPGHPARRRLSHTLGVERLDFEPPGPGSWIVDKTHVVHPATPVHHAGVTRSPNH